MSNSKVTLSYPFQKAKAKEMGGKKLAREHASPGFEEATYMGIIGKGKQEFMQQQQQQRERKV
jgi:hypothetical protein